jgi:uncharacterized integral membrane protein
MRFRGILLTVVVLLATLFAVLNWSVLVTSVPINLLAVTVQLPLGFALLLAAVGLSLLFFATALFDRAGQLRRVTQLERLIEGMQGKLDRRRLEEVDQLEQAYQARCDALDEQLAAGFARLETALDERVGASEMRIHERLEDVRERVLLVRNELAADIAEAEDTLTRRVRGEEVEPG